MHVWLKDPSLRLLVAASPAPAPRRVSPLIQGLSSSICDTLIIAPLGGGVLDLGFFMIYYCLGFRGYRGVRGFRGFRGFRGSRGFWVLG